MSDLIDRQEAIDAIRASTSKYTGFMEMEMYTDDDAVEAIINLPSAQPELAQDLPNACTDAISRRAAIDAVSAYLMLSQISRTIQDSTSLQEVIENVPAVQPERKKGKWIFLDECSNSGYYCSECNKKVVKEGWSNTVKKINFCPNCGADMRGGEANETD